LTAARNVPCLLRTSAGYPYAECPSFKSTRNRLLRNQPGAGTASWVQVSWNRPTQNASRSNSTPVHEGQLLTYLKLTACCESCVSDEKRRLLSTPRNKATE